MVFTLLKNKCSLLTCEEGEKIFFRSVCKINKIRISNAVAEPFLAIHYSPVLWIMKNQSSVFSPQSCLSDFQFVGTQKTLIKLIYTDFVVVII
jgi:hypothetical protein